MRIQKAISLISLLLLLSGTSALGHEVKINALGKGVERYDIPAGTGELFFTLLRGASARVEDELVYQLGEFSVSGTHLKELEHVNVDRNIYLAFEASSSAFHFSGRALGFDVGAELTCPVTGVGCKSICADITLSYMEANGTVDYLSGVASFSVHPFLLNVDLDAKTNIFGAVLEWLVDFLFDLRIDDLEPMVESIITDELLHLRLDAVFVGISDVLESVPPSVTTALGVDLNELLRNPFDGLLLDIALIAPLNNSGTIDIVISHRRPAPRGSVVLSGGVEKPKLSWGAVPGATKYHVFSESDSPNQWYYRATTTTTQWVDFQYNGGANTILEANSPAGDRILLYHVVAENAFGIQSQASFPVRFAVIDQSSGGGGRTGR